ncbi:MAG: DJ-1/PfpI family protein [Oscillospiraceae bacterium]|nr:DJ-1/PfpI family protein [Oscillospiraceae bacterium]
MVYILLGTGFEEIEALTPCDLLRRAGLEVALVGVNGMEIVGSHKITVRADLPLDAVQMESTDMLILPGGLKGVQSILDSGAALALIQQAWEAGKYVCAICAAPTILAKLGIVGEAPAVCYPGMEREMGSARIQDANVVCSGRLITARAAGVSVDFALSLITALKGPKEAKRIAKQVVYIGGNKLAE